MKVEFHGLSFSFLAGPLLSKGALQILLPLECCHLADFVLMFPSLAFPSRCSFLTPTWTKHLPLFLHSPLIISLIAPMNKTFIIHWPVSWLNSSPRPEVPILWPTNTFIPLHLAHGCFHNSLRQSLQGLQYQKYFLLGPLQKKFADFCSSW